ncbi:MAG: pyridoxal-phosphate dependent enzyme [Anaerolineales bacterium]|nr:pyridoxal-phosphate dependent enzyme [Anaerolineales bacterium]
MILCRACHKPFPIDRFPHRCPDCGGLFGFSPGLEFEPEELSQDLPGIWRYRMGFSLPDDAPVISLGEGNTPLVWSTVHDKKIGFKMESQNPTGSFKDRGTAVLMSWLKAAGIWEAVEDSSGNAGASFAAYAARAGIRGKVFIPASASGPKRRQIESYGSEVIPIPGKRSNAADAVLKEVRSGAVYASHAYLPQGTAGIASIAYELFEDIGGAPGTVILPVGHGSLLLGIALGFQGLLEAGLISQIPTLIGVQAAACAPLYEAFQTDSPEISPVPEGKTLAAGVGISDPFHGKEVLAAVRRSGGSILAVEESDILKAQAQLAGLGFYVEMTSALVWSGLEQIHESMPEPIVCIITGHGLKNG